MAWTREGNNGIGTRASLKKSIKSAGSVRSFFSSSRSSSSLSNSRTESSSLRSSGGGSGGVIEEEPYNIEEDGVEVGDGDRRDTMSERGTASTEAHVPHSPRNEEQSSLAQPWPNSVHTDSSQQQLQTTSGLPSSMPQNSQSNISPMQQLRKGNVQIQINGRHIPQLDMIFSSSGNASLSSRFLLGSSTAGSENDGEPSCRFVNGNGLRPSTATLEMLTRSSECDEDDSDQPTESIRNSPHHICPQKQIKQSAQRVSSIRNGGAILNFGRNLLRYTLYSKKGAIVATAESHLYLWRSTDSVIVSDVDGTVTKSDVRGLIDSVVQDRFEYCHEGICKFFHDMIDAAEERNKSWDCTEEGEEVSLEQGAIGQQHLQLNREISTGSKRDQVGEVRFLYLSSRPISLISQTRKLLVSLTQTHLSNLNDSRRYGLPPGPIFHHTGPLSSVLFSELFAKNIHEFKADVLARQVVLPFVAAWGEDWKKKPPSPYCRSISEEVDVVVDSLDAAGSLRRSWSGVSEASAVWDDQLFLAGFGNKVTDAMAYEMAGIDRRDIYIIDKESRILCMGVDSNQVGQHDGVEDAKEQYGTADQCECNSFEPETKSNAGGVSGDQSDLPLAEGCRPGTVEGQILSEFSSPVTMNESKANKAASSIHSIELSLSKNEIQPDEDVDNLTMYKTAVDIYVSSDRQNKISGANVSSGRSGGSKRSKLKQSIRAFSSKKSFSSKNKFPSFGSASSNGGSKPSGPSTKLYAGYGDPMLLENLRGRMFG